MSARTVRRFEGHCAAQGRPVPKAVDISGRIPLDAGAQRPAVTLPPPNTTLDPSEASDVALRGAGELLRVTGARRASDARLVVTLSLGELRELMREAALEAVAEAGQDVRPAVLDRAGLARALGVSPSSVDRFRKEGMPAVWAGDSPRFEIANCLAWLRGRGRP